MIDPISMSQKRDRGAIQDMYRCTLTASWQLQVGELNPEECIEDIFAGGDGWTPRSERPHRGKPKSVRYEGGLSRGGRTDGSDSDSLSAMSSGGGVSTVNASPSGNDTRRRRDGDTLSIVSFAAAPKPERKSSGRSVKSYKSDREVDEMRAREDLVSWKMPSAMR